jgi:hypothetical protein
MLAYGKSAGQLHNMFMPYLYRHGAHQEKAKPYERTGELTGLQ